MPIDVGNWIEAVSDAASGFERRWTWAALERVDPQLHRRLRAQRDLFDQAAVTGKAGEVAAHGAAMVRGYSAAAAALADQPDDAYQLGQDPRSGFRVAIGGQRGAAERVHELHGETVCWITPDEVAAILAGLEGFKAIAAIKRMFPEAEVLDVRPGEPAKEDGGIP